MASALNATRVSYTLGNPIMVSFFQAPKGFNWNKYSGHFIGRNFFDEKNIFTDFVFGKAKFIDRAKQAVFSIKISESLFLTWSSGETIVSSPF